MYQFNFKGNEPLNRGIEKLSVEYIDQFEADLFIMSPPCQPFTSGGNRLDDQDARSAGLLHLLTILPKLKNPPKFIFLENVPNFEVSRSRDMLIDVLNSLQYRIDEFLTSPITIGIPNDRKRYYLAAYLDDHNDNEKALDDHNDNEKAFIPTLKNDLSRIHRDPHTYCSFLNMTSPLPIEPLSLYIDSELTVIPDKSDFWVKEKDICKRTNFIFDCVQPTSIKTSTFTKAYGTHHFFGTGSFLQTNLLELPYGGLGGTEQEHLIQCKPRFFTPKEVARFHGFPIDIVPDHDGYGFQFPDDITTKQRWNLLGNSLNVVIVSTLLEELLLFRNKKNLALIR